MDCVAKWIRYLTVDQEIAGSSSVTINTFFIQSAKYKYSNELFLKCSADKTFLFKNIEVPSMNIIPFLTKKP